MKLDLVAIQDAIVAKTDRAYAGAIAAATVGLDGR